eukprot:CAMPEP_0113892608 /NCGR_PEP_ID=MMETSP0780_2-20120614/15532_1 /TAXON_ID=652834 /ORGANISM="Palpitomonas bilix" /LENGTH=345 /DNA_ID=CAMNT_0000882607 /DNA_START=32 /DNA_END=1069 /DNA_ORIENTATION=- /assembly_acc=CAM_ASM_000599
MKFDGSWSAWGVGIVIASVLAQEAVRFFQGLPSTEGSSSTATHDEGSAKTTSILDLQAFAATLIAGASTGLGGTIVLLKWVDVKNMKLIGYLLSFSAGVMVYISFGDILPEAQKQLGFFEANMWMFAGMVLFGVMVGLIPEPDMEHGHSHGGSSGASNESGETPLSDKSLLRAALESAVSISLHNFPEGIAVYLSMLKGAEVGIPMAVAILLHNIPEGMAVAVPVYASTGSKTKAIQWTFLSGLVEPLGALAFVLVLNSFVTNYVVDCLLAMVAGIMIILTIKELIPISLKYIDEGKCSVFFGMGMFVLFISVYFIHYRWNICPHGDHSAHDGLSHDHSHHHDHH